MCGAWHKVAGIELLLPASTTLPRSPQASRLIVTFDEHVISNNFKFGVIYQKLGQVCLPFFSPSPPGLVLRPTPPHLALSRCLPGHSVSQELGDCSWPLWEEVGLREGHSGAATV